MPTQELRASPEIQLSFAEYFGGVQPFVQEVQELMSHPLSDDPLVCDQQAREAESRRTRLREILSFADSYLDVAEWECLRTMPTRSREWTDLDRETRMGASVSNERRFRDILRGICEAVDSRVSYVQTRLRVFAAAEGGKFT